MVSNILHQYLPSDWSPMYYSGKDYTLEEIPSYSAQYSQLESKVNGLFNSKTEKIVRVQNPYLYNQFLLKEAEYATRGMVQKEELFHDTAAAKIPSIVSNNLDRRLASRVKYGRGVSFSPNPAYANRQSSRSNGTDRAMIIADVLVGMSEYVSDCKDLPSAGYDTTLGNGNQVYVKYYDNEFYPKFVVYYSSRTTQFVRGRRYW